MLAQNTMIIAPYFQKFTEILSENASLCGYRPLLAHVNSNFTSRFPCIPLTTGSFVSARSLSIKIDSEFKGVSSVVLVSLPVKDELTFDNAHHDNLSDFIDTNITTMLHLTKEMRALTLRETESSLVFVLRLTNSIDSSLLSLSNQVFRGLAENLFLVSTKEHPIFGVLDTSNNDAECSDFILKILQDSSHKNHGRWLKFSGKSNFFGLGS